MVLVGKKLKQEYPVKFEVIFKPDAEQDVSKITKWYKSIKEELGSQFLEAIDIKVEFLKMNPKIYQVRYKETRFALLNGFPYAIHYTIEKNNVYVHAVLSTNRDPIIWK